jgi:hypothetical protein
MQTNLIVMTVLLTLLEDESLGDVWRQKSKRQQDSIKKRLMENVAAVNEQNVAERKDNP